MRPVFAAGFFLAFAASAFAHVTVAPETSRGGAVERYTIRVPTEGKVTTTALDLEVKPGEVAEFVFFARNPSSGEIHWKAHQRFADGTSADWIGVEGDRRPA